MDDVEIRRYEHDDENRALRFFVSRYPQEQREAALQRRRVRWRWQYYDNPNNTDGKPIIYLAQHDGRIIGLIGTNPVRLRTPGGMERAVWGSDLMVDPRYRGRGVGQKLVDAWIHTASIAIGKGFNAKSYTLCLKLGFEVLWNFNTTHIVLSRLKLASRLLRHSQRKNLVRLAKTFVLPTACSALRGEPSISVSDAIPDGTPTLWESVAASYRFAIERDERYLAWRFGAHPAHTYHFVHTSDSGELSSLAIVRITDDRNPLGIISDLIVDPRDEETVGTLLGGTIAFLKSRGACASLIDISPALAPFVRDAFRCSIREDLGMLLYTTDPGLQEADIVNPDLWYLSRSDSDGDY